MVWNQGQQLFDGHYVIEQQLGEGGFGITYLATTPKGDRKVIKTLNQKVLNNPTRYPYERDKLIQDFRKEAGILIKCRHPHIVQVESFFEEESLPCIAMEYVEGGTLREHLNRQGVFSEAEALRYIQQIGDALMLVHGQGLLHRDIKPDNIVLRADTAEAVLIDFGIAREFLRDVSQHHTVAGTPGYAPLEQAYGKAKHNESIDVYALAATLYALLAGASPIAAWDRQGEIHEQRPDPLQPLIQVNPRVSARVSDAVMWGVALDYKQRPQSVRQWIARLLGESSAATTTLPPKKPKSFGFPTLKSVLSFPLVQGLSGQRSHFQPTHHGVENRLKPLPKINPLPRKPNKLYLLSVPLILLITLPQAHAYLRYRDFPLFSNPKLLITRLPSSLNLERTLTGVSTEGRLLFRSDGQALASLSDDGTQIWNFHTGELLKEVSVKQLRPQTSEKDEIIGLSPDFKYLATRHDQAIKIWDLNNLKQSLQTLILEDGETIEKVSSDFKHLATRHNQHIKIWGLSDLNQPLRKLNLGCFNNFIVSEDFNYVSGHYRFSFFDKCLKSEEEIKDQIKIWNLKTGEVLSTLIGMDEKYPYFFSRSRREIIDPRTGKIHHLQTSPGSDNSFEVNLVDINQKHEIAALITDSIEGSGLFRSREEGNAIKVYELGNGKLLRTIPGSYRNATSIVISSDGELLFLYEDSTYKKERTTTWEDAGLKPGIEVYNLTKGERLFRLPLEKESRNFSFNAKVAALGERNGIKLVNLSTGKTIYTLIDSGISNLTFSPNGQNLVSKGDGKIRIWKVPK